MNINGKQWRTIWLEDDAQTICVIDQTKLPHELVTVKLRNYEEVVKAISSMVVRGAPLIGVAAAYGLMLALLENSSEKFLKLAFEKLNSTRPTAVNLNWALKRVLQKVQLLSPSERASAARKEADLIAEEDVTICESIGSHGLALLEKLFAAKSQNRETKTLNVLTHCNAGWLATVDWGTALAPIYKAHHSGMKIHVWVDETRPRNQGASLTAFELAQERVPHTLIVDNAGGYLMQNAFVDVVLVGADRISSCGDVCNKIGTYLKALSAYDNRIPFYVAAPISTIDWLISDGHKIPIENRSSTEITHIQGLLSNKSTELEIAQIKLSPLGTKGFNPAFDITPSKMVTSIITENGVIGATKEDLMRIKLDC